MALIFDLLESIFFTLFPEGQLLPPCRREEKTSPFYATASAAKFRAVIEGKDSSKKEKRRQRFLLLFFLVSGAGEVNIE